MKDFKAKGYYADGQKETKEFPNAFDGYYLNQLDFSVSIHSYKDIDDLITFLKIHRPCFIRPGDAKEAYKKQPE